MGAMTESIDEIIRVLQLTSPTEEQGALATATGGDHSGLPGGILPGTLAAKVFQAKELLAQTGQWNTHSLTHGLKMEQILAENKRNRGHLGSSRMA